MTRLGRDRLQEILWAENVLARRYFYPGCHRMEPYVSSPAQSVLSLPNTEYLAQRVLCLPTGMDVNVGEVDRVCDVIRVAVAYGDEINERLDHLVARGTIN
jgi:dTDP-4-amino-4,6-dideoxygalactose transaminase